MEDIYIIAEFGEKIEHRQNELEKLATARHARRGFERCNALRYASEQLGRWFDGNDDQRYALEVELDDTIQSQTLTGGQRLALKYKLARREITQFRARMQRELGLCHLIRSHNWAHEDKRIRALQL